MKKFILSGNTLLALLVALAIWGCGIAAAGGVPSPAASTLTITNIGPGWTISTPSGISCPGWSTCQAAFPRNMVISLDGYAAPAYELAWWTGPGSDRCVNFTTHCVVDVKSGTSLTIYYTEYHP